MKNIFIVLGVVVVAVLAMGLPYLLREVNKEQAPSGVEVPVSKTEPTTKAEPTVKIKPNVPTSIDVGITIDDFKFLPKVTTVKKGTKITWNNQHIGHTVTGDNGDFDSDHLKNGMAYSRVFDTVGIFKYHCAFHPSMKGEIQVVE
ncbi:MAG: plastocyanin/azurin family copper-binding protein [Patescibacteria group bacterium]